MRDIMPTSAEVIEKLARQLERERINNDLQNCITIEDYEAVKKKYETLCDEDKH